MSKQYCPKGSSFDLMSKKIEKKIAADPKKEVTITVTKQFKFTKKDWDELKEHLEEIWGSKVIIEHFDALDVDRHLSSIKEPSKTTHRIT